MFRAIFFLVMVIGLSGCAMTYSMQGAKEVADDDVAILVTTVSSWSPYVYVSDIDGVSRGMGSFKTYRLLPGERHVTVHGNSHAGFYTDPKVVVFVAERGHRYELVVSDRQQGPYWTAGIADTATGERVDTRIYRPECTDHPWRGLRCTIQRDTDPAGSSEP